MSARYGLAIAPPAKGEGRSTPHAAALSNATSHTDSEAIDPSDQARKRFATVRAKAALLGFALHLIGDGERGSYFLVSGWNRSRTLHDMQSVEQFIAQIGGARFQGGSHG